MRTLATLAVLNLLAGGFVAARAADKPAPADKLTLDEKIELIRGLTAEYGRAKVLVPRSKKPLEVEPNGTYDKQQWAAVAHNYGPAARAGDMVRITKMSLEADRIVFQLNGGFSGGRKWYQGVQVTGSMGQDVPLGDGDNSAPGGTTIALVFHKPLQAMKAAEVKKMLAPVIDFDRHTATELYSQTLPPATQKAIQDKRVLEGMNHEQVVMALGHPAYKSRETKDGIDLEDWVFGHAPGKITFVTFQGDKVVKVKEEYAGLGTQVQ